MPQRRIGPRNRGRHLFFAGWIVMTIVVAMYVAATGLFTRLFGTDLAFVGAVVPPFMILTLGLGLAWLVWLTSTRPSRPRA